MGGWIRIEDPGGPQVPHDLSETVVHVETRPGRGVVLAGMLGLAAALVAPVLDFPASIALLAAGTTTVLTIVAALACPRRVVAFDLRSQEVWIGARRLPIASLEAARIGSRRDGTLELAVRVAGAWRTLLDGVVPAHRATLDDLAVALQGAHEASGGYRSLAMPPFEIVRDIRSAPVPVRALSPARWLERGLVGSLGTAAVALASFGHWAFVGEREAAGFSMGIATIAALVFTSFAFRLERLARF